MSWNSWLRRALAPASCVLLAASAFAADPYVFHQTTLENGLRVIVHEDRSCPVAAVQVWYHVGSKNEDPERQGFAHMFEHMMFRGTDRLGPEAHFEFIRGTGGDCNAFTSFDNTTYVQTVPSNQVPMVLWLEAERMAALKVDQAGFDTERAVVEEEARLGKNQPYGSVMEKVLERVFTTHPYRWSPIGKIEHLRRATAEELLRFWETYYVPNNAVLVVVGDVDHEAVFAEAKHAFGWIPRCDDPPRVTVKEPLPGSPQTIELEETTGPVPIVAAAYRTVGQNHPDATAIDLLMAILGGGESSRLYRKIVDDEEAAVIAAAGAFSLEDDGLAAAGCALMPFGNAKKVFELIDAELEAIKAGGVTEAELAKAKSNMLKGFVGQWKTVESKANAIGTSALFHGGVDHLNRRAELCEAVTVADVQRVAKEYLVPERRYSVHIKPTLGGMLKTLVGGLGNKGESADEAPNKKTEVASDVPPPARRGKKAEAKRPADFPEKPPVQDLVAADVKMEGVSRRLDNGMEVVVVENHEVPLVTVRLGVLNGAYEEAKVGAGSFAASMLTKGTKTRTGQQISEELEANALSLGADASLDSAGVSGNAPASRLPKLMELLSDVVKTPKFDAKEFDKLKRQTLTGMSIGEKQPASIAEREFAKALYGAFPYGRPDGGTSDDVEALTVEDCKAWWSKTVAPNRAVLYVAGDVDPDDVFDLADALFSDWNGEAAAIARPTEVGPEPSSTHIVLVDVPGAIQSQIRVGHRGIDRSNPDWFTSRVLSQIFGGAFNSRLNEVIRVQKGLTYGARGGFQSRKLDGQFFVSTFSKTATTVEAVQAILGEVERMRDEAPSDKELTQARSYLVGSFAGDHETPESIVGELWSQRVNGLPEDYAKQFLQSVVKTTAADVQRVAKDRIDPSKLSIVVVGDAAKIKAGLEAIAPVTVLDEKGQPKVDAPAAPTAPDDEDDEEDDEG